MTVTFKQLGKYGRLGNQLWQCSTTIALALRNNDNFLFPNWEYEKFFNIPKSQFTTITIQTETYQEPHFHYSKIDYHPNIDLIGYFQSQLYWIEFKDKIIDMLSPNVHGLSNQEYAFIHVRRGDYLKHTGCYEILNMNYYEKAMERFNASKYLVFSDDIEWCKNNFIGNEFSFSEGNSDIEDLELMTKCNGGICANSSFSVWGGMLSKKKMIVPNQWFGPKLFSTHDTKDLYSPDWIII